MSAMAVAGQMLRAAKRMKNSETVTTGRNKASGALSIRIHGKDGAIYDVTVTTYKEPI